LSPPHFFHKERRLHKTRVGFYHLTTPTPHEMFLQTTLLHHNAQKTRFSFYNTRKINFSPKNCPPNNIIARENLNHFVDTIFLSGRKNTVCGEPPLQG